MKEKERERKRGRQLVMRGRAIAGLARTPRRSLIVLKLEKTCQLFVTYIYTYTCMSAYRVPHTSHIHICFVLSCRFHGSMHSNAARTRNGNRAKAKPKTKTKTENPKPKIPKAAQATRHRQPKNVSAVAVDVGVAVANYMLTRTRKLISHLAQNLKSRSLATLPTVNQRRDSERS